MDNTILCAFVITSSIRIAIATAIVKRKAGKSSVMDGLQYEFDRNLPQNWLLYNGVYFQEFRILKTPPPPSKE